MEQKSLAFNLEPTFRCNLECPMCPRFSSEDPHLDMSMEVYARIHEAMPYAHTVDFTGWGEPTLHPRIYDMIAMARDQGCTTTMTSNGTALTRANSDRLIEAGLDRLTVSVDGMRPETYDPIRIGASFDRITRKLAELSERIERSGSGLLFGIAFTIQQGNAGDLPRIVPWMRSVGARVLHLKHLNVISTGEDWNNSFLSRRHDPVVGNGRSLVELEEAIEAVTASAREANIDCHMHSELPLASSLKPRHCLATPLEALYFSFEGRVAPCCHFGHHVSRYFDGELYPASSLFYGDIRKQSFEEVWRDPEFRRFRLGFEQKDFPQACRTCYLLYGK